MQLNDFQPFENQEELDELIKNPYIRSNMDAIRGILFSNKMLIVYKNGNIETTEEMDTETDRFYSRLGIAFLEQYLKHGLAHWYFKRIKGEMTLVTTCPIDGFPLETHSRTKQAWCPFCGWPYIKRYGGIGNG